MRFLCLHGKGTSGRIFKSQTATFRKLLPDTYEFDFVNGPFSDGPAAGIDLFHPPPYYKLYEHLTLESLQQGYKWLLAYINENGPYDAVMCFSQGCSMASSLLLYNQSLYPNSPPLFKAAIFICGGVPLDVLASLGVEVTAEARDLDRSSKVALQQQASTEAILRNGRERWGSGLNDYSTYQTEGFDKRGMVFGIDVARIPRQMKIQIPTVHVYGAKDPRFPASITMAQFCDETVRRTFDHGGGHEIPRKRDVSKTIAELVEWCVLMATEGE
ncbi:hypothetical protein V499_03501 [Pseudogymnoascus sp. VKM F-103]|uniref:Serine hydrolase domain-containing protein n=1 Tax=Pseudogymnoascus verrucosus TaxID=342668 RepID=A0A1B8GYH5_9PEZI|nr:uncharacterized protein VE01_01319 [Pseudogymnoascus verrucosus]KFY76981.1 hypothetical protein V499_03501 [Pseudogymnoascus sp. VKM F-103]OBU00871.1 hypothetical protein VE01_01319 [Pseudogymnoascus verrucosus]